MNTDLITTRKVLKRIGIQFEISYENDPLDKVKVILKVDRKTSFHFNEFGELIDDETKEGDSN